MKVPRKGVRSPPRFELSGSEPSDEPAPVKIRQLARESNSNTKGNRVGSDQDSREAEGGC